ncbi:MAG: APC family permease [Janthinobacterium lividum]
MGVDLPHLKRSIGLATVVSTSAGLTFASSTFLVVVQMACYLVGDAAWIAIGIAGALCALAAAAFSELNGMWPSVNGIRLYIHRAFGEKISLVAALTYMSVVTLVVGTEAYVLSHVLSRALPAISPPWWIFLMLTLATAVNFRGLKIAGTFQNILTYSVVVSVVIMSILALSHAHFVVPQPLKTGGVGPLFQAVGVAIFLFVGFEWVTPLADEVKSPYAIPTGMFLAVALLVVVYALVATAMFTGLVPRGLLFGTLAARQPIPHVRFAELALGPIGGWVMIGTSLCMSLTTFNAGLMGVSRFIYGMARDQVLPKRLSSLSTRFSTPDQAVFLVYVIALIVSGVVYWTQRFVMLVNLAAATEAFIYAFAAAAVIALRLKDKERARPFRMIGGLGLPGVTALIFVAMGIGVLTQPGVESWGAGILLAVLVLAWAIYIQFFVGPRLTKIRAEAAARPSRRPSRRPPPGDADPS